MTRSIKSIKCVEEKKRVDLGVDILFSSVSLLTFLVVVSFLHFEIELLIMYTSNHADLAWIQSKMVDVIVDWHTNELN